jgi:hypothetical protein
VVIWMNLFGSILTQAQPTRPSILGEKQNFICI